MVNVKELKELTQNLNILYVEDDKELAKKNLTLLENFFNECYVAYDGVEGLDIYKEFFKKNNRYIDIVISDIQMPKKNGIELSQDLLKINEEQKIVIISAYSDSKYLKILLNIGVSKFLSKPFERDQLLEVLYQCSSKLKNIGEIKLVSLGEGFIWNKESKSLQKDSEPVKLTKNEQIILELLINNSNQVFPDEVIFNTIHFDNAYKDMSIDSIRSIIKRLRKKLPVNVIENIYGNGYKINLAAN